MNDEPAQLVAKSRSPAVSYVIGFGLSLALTLAAYYVVTEGGLSTRPTVGIIVALAVVQLMVQLVFFLHLGSGRGRRWNAVSFAFMLIVLVILVFGSLWIMNNLDYHMKMSPAETDQYIIEDEIIKP